MTFWILVGLLGLFGALADVVLNQWSKTLSLNWWLAAATLFLVFMTGFGIAMRLGETRGLSLTAVVLVVLLANISGVAVWDLLVGGTRFTTTQWIGAVLAVAAMVCFELGKK